MVVVSASWVHASLQCTFRKYKGIAYDSELTLSIMFCLLACLICKIFQKYTYIYAITTTESLRFQLFKC